MARLAGAAGGNGFGKGALQQQLRDHRLGMDGDTLPEQDRPNARKNDHDEQAAHNRLSSVHLWLQPACETEGARLRGKAARHGQGLGGMGG